jgi:hypothetical protein
MLNFTAEMNIRPSKPSAAVETAPVITERVSVRRPETRITDVGKASATWTWEDLRNYVVRQIEATHGPFPRDAAKEGGIFKAFLSRWENLAGPIAEFAFEECEGMWRGAPVAVTRFCKGSDPYFAAPIAERLTR